MTDQEKFEVTSDAELSDQLHQLLIVDGLPEVEVVHPTEGLILVTQDSYKDICKALDNYRNLSPAKRLLAKQEFERKKELALMDALSNKSILQYVDISDDDNFGCNTAGEELDLQDRYMLLAQNYHAKVPVMHNEVGAFVDAYNRHTTRPPIRLVHNPAENLSEVMQELAESCPPEDYQTLIENLNKSETPH